MITYDNLDIRVGSPKGSEDGIVRGKDLLRGCASRNIVGAEVDVHDVGLHGRPVLDVLGRYLHSLKAGVALVVEVEISFRSLAVPVIGGLGADEIDAIGEAVRHEAVPDPGAPAAALCDGVTQGHFELVSVCLSVGG